MKSTKTTYLVRIALLMAITIVLAATPLGYIPAGVLSFTIMVLPVAIGGVLMEIFQMCIKFSLPGFQS